MNEKHRLLDKSKLISIMLFILTISLPGSVKCDMGDSVASIILFLIISVFLCAGIGWWSRRQEGSK